jgi:hypothetical protein
MTAIGRAGIGQRHQLPPILVAHGDDRVGRPQCLALEARQPADLRRRIGRRRPAPRLPAVAAQRAPLQLRLSVVTVEDDARARTGGLPEREGIVQASSMPSICTASNTSSRPAHRPAPPPTPRCAAAGPYPARATSAGRAAVAPVVRSGTAIGGKTRANSARRAVSAARSRSAKLSRVTSWRRARARSRWKLRRLVPCCGG